MMELIRWQNARIIIMALVTFEIFAREPLHCKLTQLKNLGMCH